MDKGTQPIVRLKAFYSANNPKSISTIKGNSIKVYFKAFIFQVTQAT
jgi:hypothetical protein